MINRISARSSRGEFKGHGVSRLDRDLVSAYLPPLHFTPTQYAKILPVPPSLRRPASFRSMNSNQRSTCVLIRCKLPATNEGHWRQIIRCRPSWHDMWATSCSGPPPMRCLQHGHVCASSDSPGPSRPLNWRLSDFRRWPRRSNLSLATLPWNGCFRQDRQTVRKSCPHAAQ